MTIGSRSAVLTDLDGWHEQLRRGGLDLAILLTLAPGRRYGLEIIRHLEAFTDLIVTEGTVYPILSRLTRDGLLEAQWEAGEGPHPRKYYVLTAAGRGRLADMIGHWTAFTAKIGRLIEAAERRS
jgi:PadR family transcriptional regulator